MDDPKFNYFKTKVLKYLDELEKKEQTDRLELKKSLQEAEELAKGGKGLPLGTEREWKGKKYKKIAPGRWRRKYENESRSAKMAVAAIKRQADACKDTRGLMQLIIEHKDRFSDEKGHPIPLVRELSAYLAERNVEILKDLKKTEQRKTDNAKYSLEELDSYYRKENQMLRKLKAQLAAAEKIKNKKTIKQLKELVQKHEKYRDEYKEERDRKRNEGKKDKVAAEKKLDLAKGIQEQTSIIVRKSMLLYLSDKLRNQGSSGMVESL